MTTLQIDQAGRVLTVRMSNPPRNFMTARMVAELAEVVGRVEDDRDVGAVVLTGAVEGAFITHYDVAEILAGAEAAGVQVSPGVAGGALRATGALGRIPGAADALRLPEITLGLIPGGGGTQRLARMLGTSRALEMMLEGRVLAPHEASELGLVHRVVAPEVLAGEAAATAERLARRAPGTIAALKRAVYEGATRDLSDGLHMERAAFMSVTARPPAVRAMRAYVDEVERADDAVPFAVEDRMRRWQEGTAVDLTE